MRVMIFLIALAFLSCNSDSRTVETDDDTVNLSGDQAKETPGNDKPAPSANVEGCFWKILQRDTLVAHLQQTGNNVSGKLSFDNFQKDGSSGPVKGIIEDGIIKLWYNFESEGTKSVMEIYFKKEGDILVRGVGPSAVKADTSYFTDHAAIKFDNSQSFTKVDCGTVPARYK